MAHGVARERNGGSAGFRIRIMNDLVKPGQTQSNLRRVRGKTRMKASSVAPPGGAMADWATRVVSTKPMGVRQTWAAY
jgi:hypothetical protein